MLRQHTALARVLPVFHKRLVEFLHSTTEEEPSVAMLSRSVVTSYEPHTRNTVIFVSTFKRGKLNRLKTGSINARVSLDPQLQIQHITSQF